MTVSKRRAPYHDLEVDHLQAYYGGEVVRLDVDRLLMVVDLASFKFSLRVSIGVSLLFGYSKLTMNSKELASCPLGNLNCLLMLGYRLSNVALDSERRGSRMLKSQQAAKASTSERVVLGCSLK